jgi:putative tryptophan/tyrosine transport system substrate-binding protein
MAKSFLILLLTTFLLTTALPAEAQQPKKVPRIGILHGASASSVAARTEVFREGLRELGYVEGKNIVIEWRYAEGKADRLPGLAAELVGLKVDIIVTTGPIVTRPPRKQLRRFPLS